MNQQNFDLYTSLFFSLNPWGTQKQTTRTTHTSLEISSLTCNSIPIFFQGDSFSWKSLKVKSWLRNWLCDVFLSYQTGWGRTNTFIETHTPHKFHKILEHSWKIEIVKITRSLFFLQNLWCYMNVEFTCARFPWNTVCSTSFPGGYLVDGLPPAQHRTTSWFLLANQWS